MIYFSKPTISKKEISNINKVLQLGVLTNGYYQKKNRVYYSKKN